LFSQDVIVEECISRAGEISVEGVVSHTEPHVIAITHKVVRQFGGVEFAEMGHVTSVARNHPKWREINTAVTAIAKALALQSCAFHAEFIITPTDELYFVELGARLGGDLIPLIVEAATGFHFVTFSVNVALGTDKSLSRHDLDEGYVGVIFPTTEKAMQKALAVGYEDSEINLFNHRTYNDGERAGHICFSAPKQKAIAFAEGVS